MDSVTKQRVMHMAADEDVYVSVIEGYDLLVNNCKIVGFKNSESEPFEVFVEAEELGGIQSVSLDRIRF